MPSLRDVVAKAHGMAPTLAAGPDTVYPDYYAPRHEAWLRLPERDREWSPEALDHARKVFAGEYKHERIGRFSPSSMGSDCHREMLFSFVGAPKLPGSVQNEDKAESGTFEHLRWQMEGLTMGWLSSAEGWIHNEDLRCGGSMDGIGEDGSLFEYKNTASHLFASIKTGKGSAKEFARKMVKKHKLQMATYKVIDKMMDKPRLGDFGSLVYQDAGTKEVYEIRVKFSDEREDEVHQLLGGLHEWIDLNALPEMLDGCAASITPGEVPTNAEKGVYARCAYREWCPTAKMVTLSG